MMPSTSSRCARDRAHGLIDQPTIVSGVSLDDSLMESELFNTILPIVDCDTKEDAVRIINEGGHPLALYVFTNNNATRDYSPSLSDAARLI